MTASPASPAAFVSAVGQVPRAEQGYGAEGEAAGADDQHRDQDAHRVRSASRPAAVPVAAASSSAVPTSAAEVSDGGDEGRGDRGRRRAAAQLGHHDGAERERQQQVGHRAGVDPGADERAGRDHRGPG